jgi:hypothetical protein
MSFILQAVKKQQQSQTKVISPPSSPNIAPSSLPFLAWGVLLMIAIFIALLIGFWLGKSTFSSLETTAAIKESPKVLVSENKRLMTENQLLAVNKTEQPIEKKQTQVASHVEGLFDEPPQPTNNALQVKKSDNKTATFANKQDEKATVPENHHFNLEPTTEVSAELFQRFQQAINETVPKTVRETSTSSNKAAVEIAPIDFLQLPSIAELPATTQQKLPKMSFTQHVYASDGSGWVRVNGLDKNEGELITPSLKLVKILPQKVVLEFEQQRFVMSALSQWP